MSLSLVSQLSIWLDTSSSSPAQLSRWLVTRPLISWLSVLALVFVSAAAWDVTRPLGLLSVGISCAMLSWQIEAGRSKEDRQ